MVLKKLLSYVDDLRVGNKYLVSVPELVRSQLGIVKESSVVFHKKDHYFIITFLSYEQKKKLVQGKESSFSGEYLGEAYLDKTWNFHLTSSLRKQLKLNPGDYLVLFKSDKELLAYPETYQERKITRENQCE